MMYYSIQVYSLQLVAKKRDLVYIKNLTNHPNHFKLNLKLDLFVFLFEWIPFEYLMAATWISHTVFTGHHERTS